MLATFKAGYSASSATGNVTGITLSGGTPNANLVQVPVEFESLISTYPEMIVIQDNGTFGIKAGQLFMPADEATVVYFAQLLRARSAYVKTHLEADRLNLALGITSDVGGGTIVRIKFDTPARQKRTADRYHYYKLCSDTAVTTSNAYEYDEIVSGNAPFDAPSTAVQLTYWRAAYKKMLELLWGDVKYVKQADTYLSESAIATQIAGEVWPAGFDAVAYYNSIKAQG